MGISYDLKRRCVEATGTARQIYNTIFLPEHEGMCFETFKRKLQLWRKREMADTNTLEQGTYPGFTAHAATVQVDAEGNITQAWIKQNTETDWREIIDAIKDGIEVRHVDGEIIGGDTMLEIPLFDMHFGVASFEDYEPILKEILEIISKGYDEINILIGQDVLHNNDFRGHTAKGTQIQTVDFPKAWSDAWEFFCNILDASLGSASSVNVRYSKGNHDECSAWCFFKALEAAYPQAAFDDDISPRKFFWWEGCFIGYGHCEYTQSPDKLLRDFALEFPMDFATAECREIHTGHFHRESVDDGVMVRRLASAVPTDEWSSNNGFTGAHKRFQLFEYAPCRLRSIYYV